MASPNMLKLKKQWEKNRPEPRPVEGYKMNDFANRKTRRRIAKARGYFSTMGMWKWSNLKNKNVQTWRKSK